jgi:hypothetical protein
MRSGYYGIPLSIKGGSGNSREKRAEKGKKISREANLGFWERSVETYKIYIL